MGFHFRIYPLILLSPVQIQKLDESWQLERAGLKEKLERLQKVHFLDHLQVNCEDSLEPSYISLSRNLQP